MALCVFRICTVPWRTHMVVVCINIRLLVRRHLLFQHFEDCFFASFFKSFGSIPHDSMRPLSVNTAPALSRCRRLP